MWEWIWIRLPLPCWSMCRGSQNLLPGISWRTGRRTAVFRAAGNFWRWRSWDRRRLSSALDLCGSRREKIRWTPPVCIQNLTTRRRSCWSCLVMSRRRSGTDSRVCPGRQRTVGNWRSSLASVKLPWRILSWNWRNRDGIPGMRCQNRYFARMFWIWRIWRRAWYWKGRSAM